MVGKDLYCVACQAPVDPEQPYWCHRCFIPVPIYQDTHYIGPERAFCPHCDQDIGSDRSVCANCGKSTSFLTPPQPAAKSKELLIREENRAKLAKEVLADNRMTQQVIEMLGIGHLPREQQGVALSALAREKLNFLSVEYSLTEAHTLADMAHAITTEVEETWAIQVTATRLAMVLYRKGQAMEATRMLHRIYEQAPQETEIQQFRKLEILAHLALAHSLAGNGSLAAEIAEQAHDQALLMYQNMEDAVMELIELQNATSQFQGVDESGVTYPRVDLIFNVLVILAEELISRGNDGIAYLSDRVLNRMMELDNLMKILGNISPNDDTTYFGSYLRDYVRIFNGLLWYGDVLIENDHTRRRYLIEKYFERIDQWSYLLPPEHLLSLRPARFLEIFLRAQIWAEIDVDSLIKRIMAHSPAALKPRFHYVLADAYAKVNRLDAAVEQLNVILEDQEDYTVHADDELRVLVRQLFNSIHLESLGILVGQFPQQSSWMELPLSIQLDEVTDYLEPESYLRAETRPPLLRMVFETPAFEQGLALFGDRVLERFSPFPAIRKVGDRDFRDVDWHSTGKQGPRTDIVVLRTELTTQTLSLLFEGQPQEMGEDGLIPSRLLFFRGMISTHP
ncbi:MAG: hypothetical protein ACXAE3_13655, partial [Candidatus Kariarchaeaceae archaeon]